MEIDSFCLLMNLVGCVSAIISLSMNHWKLGFLFILTQILFILLSELYHIKRQGRMKLF